MNDNLQMMPVYRLTTTGSAQTELIPPDALQLTNQKKFMHEWLNISI